MVSSDTLDRDRKSLTDKSARVRLTKVRSTDVMKKPFANPSFHVVVSIEKRLYPRSANARFQFLSFLFVKQQKKQISTLKSLHIFHNNIATVTQHITLFIKYLNNYFHNTYKEKLPTSDVVHNYKHTHHLRASLSLIHIQMCIRDSTQTHPQTLEYNKIYS